MNQTSNIENRITGTTEHPYVLFSSEVMRGYEGFGLGQSSDYETDASFQLGKILGLGLTRKRYSLTNYFHNGSPLEKKLAILSTGFSSLNSGYDFKKYVESGMNDSDIEIREASLLSYGLINLGKGNEDTLQRLLPFLNSRNWRMRSKSGLAAAASFIGTGRKFYDELKQVMDAERNAYVKVCLSWYFSLALAGHDGEDLGLLTELAQSEDSCYRDMSALGFGYASFGRMDEECNMGLEKLSKDDHPYVRESSMYGTGLSYFGTGDEGAMKILSRGLNDDSPVVRSSTGIALGLLNYKKKKAVKELGDLLKEKDSSIKWGACIGSGLTNISSHDGEINSRISDEAAISDDYVKWGAYLGKSYLNLSTNPHSSDSKNSDFSNFGKGFAECLINSDVSEEKREPLSLIIPANVYYGAFDSFWWGLFNLHGVGAIMLNEKR